MSRISRMHIFDFFKQNAERKKDFDAFMRVRRTENQAQWFEVYPVEKDFPLGERKADDAALLVVAFLAGRACAGELAQSERLEHPANASGTGSSARALDRALSIVNDFGAPLRRRIGKGAREEKAVEASTWPAAAC